MWKFILIPVAFVLSYLAYKVLAPLLIIDKKSKKELLSEYSDVDVPTEETKIKAIALDEYSSLGVCPVCGRSRMQGKNFLCSCGYDVASIGGFNVAYTGPVPSLEAVRRIVRKRAA